MNRCSSSKKSVSFKNLNNYTENTFQDESSCEKKCDSDKFQEFFKMKKTPFLFPFHNGLMLFIMFKWKVDQNVIGVLLRSIPLLFALQFIHNFLILKKKKYFYKKKKKLSLHSLNFCISILSLLLSIPLCCLIMLFGAPITTYVFKTFLLSIHLSIILFNPILTFFELNFEAIKDTINFYNIYELLFKNEILSSFIFGLIGTWFGVLPIPLDWDKSWQSWPITLLIGGYVGSLIGPIIYFFLKR